MIKSKTITLKHEGLTLTHFNYGRADYTLCGMDNMGDSFAGIEITHKQNKIVNCSQCIDIVKYCHAIEKSEFKQ